MQTRISYHGRIGSILLLLAAAQVFASCGGGSDSPTPPTTPPPNNTPPAVATVSLDRASASLVQTETIRLTATMRDASGNALTGRALLWSSNASTIASVSTDGLVTALLPGTAVIDATSEGRSAQATITVMPTPVATVSLDRTSLALVQNQTTTLLATARDAAGNVLDRVVTWSSSATTIASVSTTGLVSALAPGTAVISATSEGRSADATITISALVVPVASVQLSADSIELLPAEQRTITASARAANGSSLTGRTVTWSVANASVATIANGVVVAIAPGITSVTATVETVSASAKVVVKSPVLAPILTTIAPVSAIVGSGGMILSITGVNFVLGAQVRWNGASRPTTFVSATQLTAQLTAADFVAVGATSVTVTNPGTDGGTSNASAFNVVSPVPSLTAAISVGIDFSCALSAARAAYCWGEGEFAQLGNASVNARTNSPNPVSNSPLFVSLSAHLYGACGLTAASALWCWGNVTSTLTGLPTLMTFPQQFTSVVVSTGVACGLTVAGKAWCWGANSLGALGDGSLISSTTPLAVSGGHVFKQLAPGNQHTCGLTTAGEAWCWGYGFGGKLGNGLTASSPTPVRVAGGLLFERIAVGNAHSCGLTMAGAAWCWGLNANRQLGDGTTLTRLAPVAVGGGKAFTTLTLGEWQSCGLSAGQAWCWGDAITLGNDATEDSGVPVQVSGGRVFESISANGRSTCALTSAGAAWCWGVGSFGNLGSGSTSHALTPVAVVGNHSFKLITGGSTTTCALTLAGAAFCWGVGSDGQLGDGNPSYRTRPGSVVGGASLVSISSGDRHTCGLTQQGQAWCWGYGDFGRLGHGSATRSNMQVAVSGGMSFSQIDAGGDHTCALALGGAAWCWGEGGYGQLGTGSGADVSVPVAVSGGLTFSQITSGAFHTCGLTPAGATHCWGDNAAGQLGTIAYNPSSTPKALTGGHVMKSIAAGDVHTCGLNSMGKAWCWGSNSNGAVGVNEPLFYFDRPQAVLGGHVFETIYAGFEVSCALKADGAAWCWGANSSGQLGDGTTSTRLVPVAVAGGHAFTTLALSSGVHTCGLKANGTAWCWGSNGRGRLGTESNLSSTVPVQVLTLGAGVIWGVRR